MSIKVDDRLKALDLLEFHFSCLSDKGQAWQDLHKLAQDEDCYVRRCAAYALVTAFSQLPDRNQAWQDLVRLTQDKDWGVQWRAADALVTAFGQVPDRNQAWQDLVRLTQDKDWSMRWRAAKALVTAFGQVPDRNQAWQVLVRLTQDKDWNVRRRALESLGSAFSQVSDKDQAWQDLVRLTQDKDGDVRRKALESLGSAFSQVSDKDQVWQDLVRLTQDKDGDVRWRASESLGSAFSQVSDKDQVWQDLVRLTQDKDGLVQRRALESLGSAFSQVSDKDQAWQDLVRLTQDKNKIVRRRASEAQSSAFSLVSDKDQAWQDLVRLTQDEDSVVRMYAYYSLGRASVFKATEAKADDKITLKHELKVAIAYFEKSSKESGYGPARFCFPFYRTYYAITFQEAKEGEVQKYFEEATEAVGGSKSKDDLLKAVENLAHALQESQRLKDRSIQEISSELNSYRWYCEKAADHMSAAEDKAPGAIKLMRKCNPLLEEQIQATIAEIQKSAKKICQITRGSGTVYEAPGAELQEASKSLSAGDLASVQNYSTKIVWQLKKFCQQIPPEDKEQVCSLVEEIVHEADFPEKLHKILTALLCLSPVLEGEILQRIEAKVDVIHENTKFLGLYFNDIEFAILNLKVGSGNAKKDLLDIKKRIDQLQSEIETQGLSEKELTIALEDKDHALIERLTKMQEHMNRAVRDISKLSASKRDVETILKKLDKQDGFKKMDALGIISDISQLLQMALKIYLTGCVV